MKRILSILTVIAVLSLSVPAFAETVEKFKGGLKDVVMSPLQVSDNIKTETAGHGFLPFELVGGLLKGTFYMAKDVVTGTVDMVTSPLDMIHK